MIKLDAIGEIVGIKRELNLFNHQQNIKLMWLDRPPAKFWSKSYSNQLLIDFFDPNLAVRSIDIDSNSDSDFDFVFNFGLRFWFFILFISKIGLKMTFSTKNGKFDQIFGINQPISI